MKRVVVASHNPVKLDATRRAFERIFPGIDLDMQPVSVPSGVADQPMTQQETLSGATQRAEGAAAELPKADYWVGIEGGIEETGVGMLAHAWVVVIADGITGHGRSGGFVLPPEVARLVRNGTELGHANDLVFGRENSKQQEGAIGLLTDKAMDRRELYEHAVVLALAPVKNRGLYQASATMERTFRPLELTDDAETVGD